MGTEDVDVKKKTLYCNNVIIIITRVCGKRVRKNEIIIFQHASES